MKGNKTAWEDEADESGLSSIRKNHAPVYGPTGGEFSSPSSEAFNRGGFRGFGEVGPQSFLPNGEYISYKDIDLPKGLTNLLGIGGSSGKRGAEKNNFGESALEIDLTKPWDGTGSQTPYPSPLANDPAARKLHPFQSGYMTDSPNTLDFFDTNIGKGEAGQFYKRNKSFIDPIAKGILTTLFLGPAAGLSTGARGIHDAFVKGSTPGSGKYDSRIDAWTTPGFDRYAASPWAIYGPKVVSAFTGR